MYSFHLPYIFLCTGAKYSIEIENVDSLGKTCGKSYGEYFLDPVTCHVNFLPKVCPIEKRCVEKPRERDWKCLCTDGDERAGACDPPEPEIYYCPANGNFTPYSLSTFLFLSLSPSLSLSSSVCLFFLSLFFSICLSFLLSLSLSLLAVKALLISL